jgi:Flp pilus assembly protein TadG
MADGEGKQMSGFAGKTRKLGHGLRRRGLRAAGKGQTLVELALVLPMLLGLVLGVIDAGRLAYYSIEVSSAARAGVAYGSQSHATAAQSSSMVQAAENNAPDVPGLTATASHFCQCANNGASDAGCSSTGCPSSHPVLFVHVSTQAKVNTLFGIPAKTCTLKGSAVMRAEQ